MGSKSFAQLPEIQITGKELLSCLNQRRSQRSFTSKQLTLHQLSLILWSANGKNAKENSLSRVIPSAGALYPLEIYLSTGKSAVEGLPEGLYHYKWQENGLERLKEGDFRARIAEACLNQEFIQEAPVSLIICAEYSRTTSWYGKRGERYVLMESGSSSQNISLICEFLGLGTVLIGAFNDAELKTVLGLPTGFDPLLVMPVGFSG